MNGKKNRMRPTRHNEKLLIDYLLGNLSEDEQVRVEDSTFAGADDMGALEAVEADLIDAYVNGQLPQSERSGFERRFLASAHRRGKVEFARALAGVATESKAGESAASRLSGPPSVDNPLRRWRERLMEAPPVFPPAALARVPRLAWKATPFDGIHAKILFSDPGTGNVTSLIRMRAGASYPAHHHAVDEHTFVLEGDVEFGDHRLYAGDYEVARGHSAHSPLTTRSGCVVLLINNVADHILY
jgi:mannose-6-phosphate isomerase-like protein (cupin superfamily)